MAGGEEARTSGEHWLQVTPSINLYYRDYGPVRGGLTPVLCLPGYWRNSRDFEQLGEHLSGARRVITPDLRGRGRTSRSETVADYEFERLAKDVLQLLDAVRVTRVVFLGTALGAHLSWAIAQDHPDRVAGMVLNDSGPEAPSASSSSHMASFAGGGEYTYEQALARIREQNAASFPRLTDADWDRMTRRAYAQTEDGKWVRDFDQRTNEIIPALRAKHPDWWPEYRAVKAPIAILRGQNSGFLTEAVAQRMVAENPAATLYTIPDTGHPPTLFEAESFAAIDELLTRVDAEGRASATRA
jgi:pimeloyl-ACP methyl ester carboxylesterase